MCKFISYIWLILYNIKLFAVRLILVYTSSISFCLIAARWYQLKQMVKLTGDSGRQVAFSFFSTIGPWHLTEVKLGRCGWGGNSSVSLKPEVKVRFLCSRQSCWRNLYSLRLLTLHTRPCFRNFPGQKKKKKKVKCKVKPEIAF